MRKDSRIYVAGHTGMVGSSIVRRLVEMGYQNLLLRTHQELDLENQKNVNEFFYNEKPEFVFLAAAKVGGIQDNNTYPADFIYNNLMIEANVIHASYQSEVNKLLFLGSSCIYPKFADQPMKEEYLLTGPLEPTNEAYAVAKIAGIELCKFYRRQYGCDFISAMPTNLYGPNDNFDLETSHVLPALIRKFHEAVNDNKNEVVIWGTGNPRREFLHVDDAADAMAHLMLHYSDEAHVNVGTGEDVSIAELADILKNISGFSGDITYDTSKPDGTPRKLLDVSRLSDTGWKYKIPLHKGIQSVYDWYTKNINKPGC